VITSIDDGHYHIKLDKEREKRILFLARRRDEEIYFYNNGGYSI